MKYSKFLAFAAFGSLLLASCASDEPLGPNDRPNDGKVQFTINLDGAQTRAYGETPSCNELYYTVYDMENNVVLADQHINAFGDGVTSTTVELQLVANQKYKVIFYAHNTGSTFSSYADGKVTVNYANKNINSNIDDAFINKKEYTPAGATTALENQVFTADGNAKTVYLTRPFAQVNIGTDDLNSPAVKNIINGVTTQFTVSSGLFTEYSILNEGSVGVPYTDTYTASTGVPSVNPNFPVEPETYSNLLSVYLLVPQTQDVVNAQYTINLTGKPAINNLNLNAMPVRGNYRTNIYGSLLTTQNQFTVTIDPIFGTPSYTMPQPWDGTTAMQPANINAETKSITINRPEELAWLAQQLAAENNEYAAYNVNLGYDLDLNGKAWTPIGSQTAYTGKFNGNGHTIKNLTISVVGSENIGLFAQATNGAVIDNLNLENVNISNSFGNSVGAAVGYVENATVSNVKVLSGSISGMGNNSSDKYGSDGLMIQNKGIGGVVGTVRNQGTVANCTNKAQVKGSYRYAGGIVGAATGTVENGDINISDCHNEGTINGAGFAGGIVGISNAIISKCTNEGAVTGTGEGIGGIAGEQRIYGSITGCVNNKTVSKTGTSYGCGGIVGFVRYYGATAEYGKFYQKEGLITVEGNTNNASISGGQGTGGIVGIWFNYGFCNGNINNATAIASSDQFAAGIIGGIQPMFNGAMFELPEVPAGTKLVVTGNTSTTTDANITATNGCKATIVYNNFTGNSATKTEISDNSPANKNL